MTYIVDVDPDGDALDAVDGHIILEVLAEDLARHHVVQKNLKMVLSVSKLLRDDFQTKAGYLNI